MPENRPEALLAETPPTPEQLIRLANIGLSSAAERNRIKHLTRTKQAHFFYDELDIINEASLITDVGQMRHRMAGRIGVKSAARMPKTWSLRVYDTFFVELSANQWQTSKMLYRFEWTRLGVNLATRAVRLMDDPRGRDDEDLADVIDRFKLEDDVADLWHAQSEFETVSAEDCDALIGEMSEYYRVVDIEQSHAA